MVAATKRLAQRNQACREELAVSPRRIEDAYTAWEVALASATQPEEIRPGLTLCCAGRVLRAVEIAGTQPPEKWPALHVEIERLGAEADRRRAVAVEAERHYHELCGLAGVTPQPAPSLPVCTCVGCQLMEANAAYVQSH
jgi:hypothetical protein